uniref:Uncharacterized protein n=1 Tax=Picea glauca TaxID=3330 RepID=A0A101LX47_PICGL|nr:hypothetical protein ABT39_MTgene6400 [Picea glauca]QHR86267.1 hypothetical protein Q903MT_gene266 [Picea sitchensis]
MKSFKASMSSCFFLNASIIASLSLLLASRALVCSLFSMDMLRDCLTH